MLISIITPTHAPSAHLDETTKGVLSQELPEGWELEWLIQEDGRNPQLSPARFSDTRFLYEANSDHLGVAMTRNNALRRANGELIQVLDHDDVLLPHALTTLIKAFEDPSIGWAVAQAHDLMPDGSLKEFPPQFDFGRVPAGHINDRVVSNGGQWPVHCASLMLRASLLRAVGGWAALPTDDELSMFTAISELSDGWHFEPITWLYRQYPEQIHRSSWAQKWSVLSREMAVQRAKALRAIGSNASSIDQHSNGDVSVNRSVKDK